MDIVELFDNDEECDDDYDNNSGAIPSNSIFSAEAAMLTVPQIRAFAAAVFLGKDVALFFRHCCCRHQSCGRRMTRGCYPVCIIATIPRRGKGVTWGRRGVRVGARVGVRVRIRLGVRVQI